MIDTIKIKLTKGKVNSGENFSPEYKKREYSQLSDTEKKLKNNYLRKFILKKDIRNSGPYTPNIEIYEKLNKKTNEVYAEVLIEFSVPKLVLDNNLEEIGENKLNKTVRLLQKRLDAVGLYTKEEFIRESVITSKMHVGKNIILPKNYSMKSIIDYLKNTELGKDYDVTERTITQLRYENKLKNKNEIMHFYSGSKEYIFYDKVKDILNRKIKSIDKDTTSLEKELLDSYNLKDKEIFRYEYRMNRFNVIKSSVNKILKRSPNSAVTLETIFNENLWQELIVESWKKIISREENQLSLKFNGPNEPKDIIRMLFINCTKNKKTIHSQNLAFSSYGLAYMDSQFGMKYIRSECEKFWSKRACGNRLREKIKEAVELFKDLKYPDNINYIDSEITKNIKLNRKLIGAQIDKLF